MHWLGGTYVTRFNRRHDRVGHLFQGRFKAILVQSETFMLRLSTYNHRNPLRANLAERLSDYRWSSYRHYAYGQQSPPWLNTDDLLTLCSGNTLREKRKDYRKHVQSYSDEDPSLGEDIRLGFILGSREYAAQIIEKFLPLEVNPDIPRQRSRVHENSRQSLPGILARACAQLDCDLELMRNAPRIPRNLLYKRDLLLYSLWLLGSISNKEIGRQFGLTSSSVSKRISSIHHDKQTKNKALKLKSLITNQDLTP